MFKFRVSYQRWHPSNNPVGTWALQASTLTSKRNHTKGKPILCVLNDLLTNYCSPATWNWNLNVPCFSLAGRLQGWHLSVGSPEILHIFQRDFGCNIPALRLECLPMFLCNILRFAYAQVPTSWPHINGLCPCPLETDQLLPTAPTCILELEYSLPRKVSVLGQRRHHLHYCRILSTNENYARNSRNYFVVATSTSCCWGCQYNRPIHWRPYWRHTQLARYDQIWRGLRQWNHSRRFKLWEFYPGTLVCYLVHSLHKHTKLNC